VSYLRGVQRNKALSSVFQSADANDVAHGRLAVAAEQCRKKAFRAKLGNSTAAARQHQCRFDGSLLINATSL